MLKVTRRALYTALLVFLFVNTQFKAQGLEETLSNLASTAAKAYVAPVVSAFGSNLNSGWVSKLPSQTKLGFSLDLKIVAMGSFFTDENKTFTAAGQFKFTNSQIDQILSGSDITPTSMGGQANYDQLKTEIANTSFDVEFSGPTVAGDDQKHLMINFAGKQFTSDQGQYDLQAETFEIEQVKGILKNMSIFPTASVQLTVGTVAGTNVSFRYFPSVDIKDVGKFSFWGMGAIHNPGVWFKNPIPLDFGIGYFFQKMKVGDILESNATQFGIYAGKTIGAIISISPYVGLVFENSKTSVKYTANNNYQGISTNPTVKFDVEGENSTGFVLGFNLKLAVVNINADYKFAKTKTASAGISFGF